jgi:transcriptional regulator with XRE-family HTH domain
MRVMLPNPKSSNFRHALRNARKDASLTHKELADQAGISHVMPGRYERGESRPTMSTWQELNKVFYGEIDELEFEEDEVESGPGPKKSGMILSLTEASIEDIMDELKDRGFGKVILTWT